MPTDFPSARVRRFLAISADYLRGQAAPAASSRAAQALAPPRAREPRPAAQATAPSA